jgi:protein arginine kinase activator
MICERCRMRLATLKYTEVINGQAMTRNICETCLKEIQGDAAAGFEMAGQAPSPKGIFAEAAAEAKPVAASVTVVPDKSCDFCGTKLSEVLRTGTVGSAACYEEFRAELEPVLREQQVAVMHRGKSPHVTDKREHMRRDLQSKRGMMRSALRTENYEEAARLRDAIRGIEESLNQAN